MSRYAERTMRALTYVGRRGQPCLDEGQSYINPGRLVENGEIQRGLLEIDEAQAMVVRRIFTWFDGKRPVFSALLTR